jgi:hypothetical protein
MHRLLPLLFLACASSTPAHYERGTYRPAPPAFSPTQDAPHTVGQPGHLRAPQEYPRSPHARVLPPSPEPGLWAGDGPQASKGTIAKPSLLGIALPGIPVSETQTDVGPALGCAALWNDSLADTGLAEKVNSLKPDAKRCMVARMFLTCARVIAKWDDDSSKDGVVVLLARQKRAKLRQAADDFVREACDGVPDTADQRRLLDRMVAAFRKKLHEPE